MIPKALHSASTDPALHKSALAVYVFLHGHLDYYTFRPLKRAWLGRQMSLHDSYLTKMLQLLVRRGYLERGPKEQDHPGNPGVWTYRICLSPQAREALTDAAATAEAPSPAA